jgi:hypothetical protein
MSAHHNETILFFHVFRFRNKNVALLQRPGGSDQPDSPPSVFTVAPKKKYRFRVVYAGGGKACPITISVANHVLRVISLDGNPVTPREVTSLVMAAGQKISTI